MPNPNKKVRGRRAAAGDAKHDKSGPDLEQPQGLKRKREVEDHQEPPVSNITFTKASNEDYHDPAETPVRAHLPLSDQESPFYGLLNEEEQAYFSRANDLLELNEFNDSEGTFDELDILVSH
jgi:nucleolar protein 9